MYTHQKMKTVIALVATVLVAGLGVVGLAAWVEPVLITQANFKLTDPPYLCPIEYKFDSQTEPEGPWIPDVDGEPAVWTWHDVPSCDGTTSGSVTVTLWIYTEDGEQFVAFEVTNGRAGLVYVKGGSGGKLYDYRPDGITEDEDLHAPINPSNGKYYGVSHVSFCLCYEPQEEICYQGETAWAFGPRYVARGNWATYVPYAGAAQTVNLYAGQTLLAGTASFSASVGGFVDITIELANGFIFWGEDLDEDGWPDSDNVKVQDYATAPSGNPAPGLFAWKESALIGATTHAITVPANNFYGVHLNVAYPVPCE
jgi:hypothetical protein